MIIQFSCGFFIRRIRGPVTGSCRSQLSAVAVVNVGVVGGTLIGFFLFIIDRRQFSDAVRPAFETAITASTISPSVIAVVIAVAGAVIVVTTKLVGRPLERRRAVWPALLLRDFRGQHYFGRVLAAVTPGTCCGKIRLAFCGFVGWLEVDVRMLLLWMTMFLLDCCWFWLVQRRGWCKLVLAVHSHYHPLKVLVEPFDLRHDTVIHSNQELYFERVQL